MEETLVPTTKHTSPVKDPNPRRSNFKPLKRDAKITLILQDIVAGLTRNQIIEKYTKEWNCSPKYVSSHITEAYALIQDEEYVSQAKSVNLARLNDIYAEAAESGNLGTALKAVDLINKTAGVYDENGHNVNIQINTDKEIKLNFDD